MIVLYLWDQIIVGVHSKDGNTLGSFTLKTCNFCYPNARSGVYVLKITFQLTAGDYDVLVRFLEYNRDKDPDCDWLFVSGVEYDVYFTVCLQLLPPEKR